MGTTNHGPWRSLDEIKDSWGPLTEAIDTSLDNNLGADQEYRMVWRTVEMGFDILIEVRTHD